MHTVPVYIYKSIISIDSPVIVRYSSTIKTKRKGNNMIKINPDFKPYSNMPEDQCIKMFGCNKQAMAELPKQAFGVDIEGVTMLTMSILSDAQHVLAHGDAETARQYMNKAKFLLGAISDACYDERRREVAQ